MEIVGVVEPETGKLWSENAMSEFVILELRSQSIRYAKPHLLKCLSFKW